MLLCTSQYVDREFVSPLLTNDSVAYIFLDEKTECQNEILKVLLKLILTLSLFTGIASIGFLQ